MNKLKIHDKKYQECIRVLMNRGYLHNMNEIYENDEVIKNLMSDSVINELEHESGPSNQTKQISMWANSARNLKDKLYLLNLMDNSTIHEKQDWLQWIMKIQIELLRKSPNKQL